MRMVRNELGLIRGVRIEHDPADPQRHSGNRGLEGLSVGVQVE